MDFTIRKFTIRTLGIKMTSKEFFIWLAGFWEGRGEWASLNDL